MGSKTQSQAREERRVFSLLLTLLILVLTSVVHLCHTCHPGHWFHSGSAPHRYIAADTGPVARDEEADEPCLACLFLNSINTTEITLVFFLLSFLTGLHQVLLPLIKAFISSRLISSLRSRGPPRILFQH